MDVQTITLSLPQVLYKRFESRANNHHRTIEAELLDVVTTTAVNVDDELPAELERELASLALLDNDALWRVARSRMPVEEAEQMEEFHFKRRYEGLSEAEINTLNYLVQQYEQYMLCRAEAAVLLKERGVDISELGPK